LLKSILKKVFSKKYFILYFENTSKVFCPSLAAACVRIRCKRLEMTAGIPRKKIFNGVFSRRLQLCVLHSSLA